jgi:hypothetical protein
MTKVTLSKDDVNAFFAGHWKDFYSKFIRIERSLGKRSRSLCPFHEESDPSFSVDDEKGLFHCYGCKVGGDAFSFYGKLKGISSFPEILEGIGQEFGISGSGSSTKKAKSSGKIIQAYDYHDEAGKVLFQVCRTESKDFKQRRPDGAGGWIWNMDGVRRVLYHLPEVLQAELVLIPEGEKDVENLRSMGLTATTCPGGAGKWRSEYSESLKDKDVVILPDNDDPGRRHGQDMARSLQGIAKSVKVVDLPDLPEKGDVSDWITAGGTREDLLRMIGEAPEWKEEKEEDLIRDQFPRRSFPWEVLPLEISESLQQLARSCASSPTSLPGVAVAIFSSLIGSTVNVSPKRSWSEPLIFWSCDIRPSGAGKTPAARSLCEVLYQEQAKADEVYKKELELWESLPKEHRGASPPRPHGYFVTNLTLEGLRNDHGGHGGKVCILDEVSAFLSSQNEYKQRGGSDRESWLCLFDGKPARVVRAKETLTLSGSRISIFGGVQPGIWRKAFTQDGEVFLLDGTIFRFLPTFEGEAFFPLTSEAWSEENKQRWENLLKEAIRWSNKLSEAGERRPLILSEDAQSDFLRWRNGLVMDRDGLPEAVRGFIPKLVGYALRWSGVLYLLDAFVHGREPGSILQAVDVQKGIRVSSFYLGHILTAMDVLGGASPDVVEVTDQVIHLAMTLKAMEPEVDNGRLAIGYVQEKYNEFSDPFLEVKSPHLMGSLLRRCGLTVTGGRHKANGRVGVFCLQWDKKTKSFLESCSTYPTNPQNQQYQGSPEMEKSTHKSNLSTEKSIEDRDGWTSWTSDGQVQTAERRVNTESMDRLDKLDNFSEEEKYRKEEREALEAEASVN